MELDTAPIDQLLQWLQGLPGTHTAIGLAFYKSMAVLLAAWR